MIKVSVLYPNSDDGYFDMDYYCNEHMKMVEGNLGTACKKITVEEGISLESLSPVPPFKAMGHLYFESIEDFKNAFTPYAKEIMDDVQNYTNIEPIIQISTIKLP